MPRFNQTTIKVNLVEIELLRWALYKLDPEGLDDDDMDNLKRLLDRLDRAEGRV